MNFTLQALRFWVRRITDLTVDDLRVLHTGTPKSEWAARSLRECQNSRAGITACRLLEARFPRLKHLEDFDLSTDGSVAPAILAALAKGAWIDASCPVG